MLKFNTAFLRLGLLHTIATNMCIWAKVVVHEATEAIVHMDDHVVQDNATMATTIAPHHSHTTLGHHSGHGGSHGSRVVRSAPGE